jgi:succinate-semialdehyde dehydrogenase/glutarate-semialdehyde dehydrogenase
VQSGVHDEFVAKLAAKVKNFKCVLFEVLRCSLCIFLNLFLFRTGSGLDKDVKIGPLITRAGVAKVNIHVEDALRHGASKVAEASVPSSSGNYYSPAVLTNMSDDMMIAREETFGPVAAIFKFETEEEGSFTVGGHGIFRAGKRG